MPTKQQLVALSDFRRRLASFIRFSTSASRSAGLTMTQYLLLLHVAGRPDRDFATVGELAECLQASPHGTVALVDRCVALGLVERRQSADDGRRVEVHLTAKGHRFLDRVATLHRNELQAFRDVFRIASVNDAVESAASTTPSAGGARARAARTPPRRRMVRAS